MNSATVLRPCIPCRTASEDTIKDRGIVHLTSWPCNSSSGEVGSGEEQPQRWPACTGRPRFLLQHHPA